MLYLLRRSARVCILNESDRVSGIQGDLLRRSIETFAGVPTSKKGCDQCNKAGRQSLSTASIHYRS